MPNGSHRRPLMPLVLAALTACAPWITPAQHEANLIGAPSLIRDDLDGPALDCEGDPGATAWYVGAWDVYLDFVVRGRDQIVYFVNQAWVDEGGEDCWHEYAVEGSWAPPEPTFDLERHWDPAQSTCALNDLYVPPEDPRAYVVVDDGDGTWLVNAETSSPFAEVHLTETELTYAVGPFCVRRQEGPFDLEDGSLEGAPDPR